eukprot:352630-Chlamydomonas_euryale.AAC.13
MKQPASPRPRRCQPLTHKWAHTVCGHGLKANPKVRPSPHAPLTPHSHGHAPAALGPHLQPSDVAGSERQRTDDQQRRAGRLTGRPRRRRLRQALRRLGGAAGALGRRRRHTCTHRQRLCGKGRQRRRPDDLDLGAPVITQPVAGAAAGATGRRVSICRRRRCRHCRSCRRCCLGRHDITVGMQHQRRGAGGRRVFSLIADAAAKLARRREKMLPLVLLVLLVVVLLLPLCMCMHEGCDFVMITFGTVAGSRRRSPPLRGRRERGGRALP